MQENAMKIELKKLAIYPRLSEETTAFNADLWIDGKLVAHAKNDGHGGSTFVNWVVPRERSAQIEAALKPRVPADYTFVSGAEWVIDEIVEAQREAKATAKNDTSFKKRSAKYGTGAARFDVPVTFGKETVWIEYAKGDEAGAKAKMLKKHPTLENWTVLA